MTYPSYQLVAGDNTTVAFVFVDAGNANTAFALTGMTASIVWKVGNGASVTRTMTNDPDQVNHIGKATYQFQTADLTAGLMEVAGYVTDSFGNRVSQLVPFLWEVRPSPLV